MLFNSLEFLLVFLPITLTVFLRISDRRAALAWLVLASLIFYGYWNPIYLALIVFSILINFALGTRVAASSNGSRYWLTALGVALNLGLLGYFKYANFFVAETSRWTGLNWSIDDIVLPLAISFFTFQQIAYLVDAYRGQVQRHGLIEYSAFVTFFPQLIAGPIVHHRDMLPQFRAIDELRQARANLGIGLTIFSIGLFKKVVIADGLAAYATPVFDAALAQSPLSLAEAWLGTLAYTFQLYFDFSGYSDMAIGLGQMFGLTLPVNFASPYKARSIIDFWRAWHITLSNFLRDYLYIPLGGNRSGRIARYRNLLITMLLGGLWHGAGWTFVIWGGLHGFYLVINHLWRKLRFHSRLARSTIYSYTAWSLTLLCVALSWVFFRAESLDAVGLMLKSMTGLNGIDLPRTLEPLVAPVPGGESLRFGGVFPNVGIRQWYAFTLLIVAAGVALLTPNVFELFHDRLDSDMNARVPHRRSRATAMPQTAWAVLAGGMLAYCLISLSEPSEFLYFQF